MISQFCKWYSSFLVFSVLAEFFGQWAGSICTVKKKNLLFLNSNAVTQLEILHSALPCLSIAWSRKSKTSDLVLLYRPAHPPWPIPPSLFSDCTLPLSSSSNHTHLLSQHLHILTGLCLGPPCLLANSSPLQRSEILLPPARACTTWHNLNTYNFWEWHLLPILAESLWTPPLLLSLFPFFFLIEVVDCYSVSFRCVRKWLFYVYIYIYT